ncbi:condensation domain-containing protein [Pedobacter sp. PF22-3]|uniref:condensation domain-containing protein n=1 Tax=Pedobacter sp. PF22-3 TaxID=2994467 RepID=UPI002245C43C|nr:condensation domain-containing protein [Pedobacter sp. PF22-3]MCX2496109.1 condensation domain-containing protein [Pedobacter sp. PF22-3]
MKRRLILGERIMHVDAKTPLNCVFGARISGEINENNLHMALQKIQQKHPLLRMKIDATGKTPYFMLNENISKITVRIVDRLTNQDWLTQSKIEWYKLFDTPNEPLARLVWLKGEIRSDLLLVLPHCICDGTTILNLMRELMTLIDHPEQELAPYASFLSVQDLLPEDFKITRATHFKGKIFAALGRLFFFFKATSNHHVNQRNYAVHWKISTDDTKKLLVKCKQENTTVHAAICVAFMEAFKHIQGTKAHGKVICPVDIRRFVETIKQDTMFAFAPIVELNLDQTENHFWGKTRKLKTDLEAKVAEMKVYDLLNMSEYFHSSINKMIGFLKTTKGTHDITLSNMGLLNIPKDYKNFTIETIYSPTVAFPWKNANTLVCSTFNGQLDFSFMSNETFLREFEAWQIKDKAMELIKENLNEMANV